jgi:heat shock protein HtpX
MHQSLIELQITMVIGFMSLGLALYLIFGLWIAPAIIILAQFGFVFYSNKIFARMGGLRITRDNPIVRLIQCRLPIDASDKAYTKYPTKVLNTIKERVYAKTAEMGISCENVRKILVSTKIKCQAQDVTIGCRPQDVTMKEIDVYRLVKQTADNFHFPVPKIMVTNTSAPNAAAAGSSPKRGVVLITTGALERLSNEEMLSVLGHEFGHLRGRDPLLIFGFSAFEFLTRCYIILPAIAGPMQIPLIMTYMWVAVSLTAFIGKFLEARADLVSAIMTEKPKALANALKKIGSQKLALEESTSFRAHEWLNLDPHPPLYFRIKRMECLETPIKTKHTLIRSVRDVLAGFVKSTKCQ